MNFISLLTAFGVGSIVTALVQAWFAQKAKNDDRRFQERQAAYIGLLEAYHQAAVKPSNEAAKNFAYWQMRCDLVAPKDVRDCIQRIIETNDNPEGRLVAHEAMKESMRTDLNISR